MRTCAACGAALQGKPGARYCSATCRQRARRERMKKAKEVLGAPKRLLPGPTAPPWQSSHDHVFINGCCPGCCRGCAEDLDRRAERWLWL